MAGCTCCIIYGAEIVYGEANIDIGNHIFNVSVDTTQDFTWEDSTSDECEPDGGKVYMFGPAKATLQLTAYPWAQGQDYTLGFECPTDVNVSIPWKHVFDCRECHDCIDRETGEIAGKVRGIWKAIPMKKKNVTVTGDITGVDLFEVSGCVMPTSKYTIEASPNPQVAPQQTVQYTQLKYNGLPIPFDTNEIKGGLLMSITNTTQCDWVAGFNNVKVYLNSFSFSFAPPAHPTVTYNFDALVPFCPEQCEE